MAPGLAAMRREGVTARACAGFLMIWLTLLPFPLWDVYGWAAPGLQVLTNSPHVQRGMQCNRHALWTNRVLTAQALISFLLIGVENIGIQIEEPFAVLPLEAYCTAIQRDVREIAAGCEGKPSHLPSLVHAQSVSDATGLCDEHPCLMQAGTSWWRGRALSRPCKACQCSSRLWRTQRNM